MIRTKLGRMTGTRRAGLALVGVLGAGAVIASGTAMASTGSPSANMTGMQMSSSSSHSHAGFTKGWFDGRTVRFYYTRNFSCSSPPTSKASSKCEAGADYTQTPASTFDPLYVIVPLGFTPAKRARQ